MKKTILYLFLAILTLNFSVSKAQTNADRYPLIPMPASLVAKNGAFEINSKTKIALKSNDPALKTASDFLIETLQPSTGIKLNYSKKASSNCIVFNLDNSIKNKEGYRLKIASNQITVSSKTPVGAFLAIQTIRQLLPAEVEQKELVSNIKWVVPCADIEDAPRFEYRGMHLDVGRHMFPTAFIKKYIDMLALYKYNTFHWHLTEDQGWRIEIKQYPKLTSIGSWRKETAVGRTGSGTPILNRKYDNTPYQGFYTQEEVKEIVKYAQDRFITVIPEIEMPGHSLAALTAYPQLGCSGGPYEVATHWGVFNDVYCPKEETFTFLENVLTEVMALFPSKYIHIGGDESPKVRWKNCYHCQMMIKEKGLKDEHELQSYFIQRMEKFINSKGRKIIGWDEILEGGLAPDATVMSWRGVKGGIEAAKQHHDVIMTPGEFCYFDHYQAKPEQNEPLAIGGYLPLDRVYSYEPIPTELNAEEAKYIKGAQANVWTEYIPTTEQVEYMVYPRALALSEVVWTAKDKKDYSNFILRFKKQSQRLDMLNINYAKHVLAEDYQATPSK
ncbi:beta-N-acetylhexosaminidase [Solitalea koreensis]|uniref:beta-N-acetylhexosaminidase n=1 Tax=Solitalea koreensis TaxID=543615 RepID=A0A521B1F9_9SPHI|nr:beta-N-acetylhexosaminidase [Solitalea koreensis]SMO40932.1 hexosaminidase [Solitalea koreensis]